jgi:hypothetical protein
MQIPSFSRAPTFSLITLLCCSVILLTAPSGSVFAQGESPVELRGVDAVKERTPVFETQGAGRASRPDEWARIVCEYDVDVEWLDAVTFQFYVAVRGESRDAPPITVFRGEVTYLNIAEENRLQADMFLHPDILARYGDIERVAVLARADGRVVGMAGKPEIRNRWWEQFSPTEGVLLSRDKTPFLYVDYDAFPMIQTGGR